MKRGNIRHRKRISGIILWWIGFHAKDHAQCILHLLFVSTTISTDGFLYLGRGVLDYLRAGFGECVYDDSPGVRHIDRGLGIFCEKYLFDPCDSRFM